MNMKALIAAVVFLVLATTGCATSGRIFSDNMQPDGTYRIDAGGDTIFASATDAQNAAENHAKLLCPSGYETRSSMSGNQGALPVHRLIVKCY